jgi:hypothetical protein
MTNMVSGPVGEVVDPVHQGFVGYGRARGGDDVDQRAAQVRVPGGPEDRAGRSRLGAGVGGQRVDEVVQGARLLRADG